MALHKHTKAQKAKILQKRKTRSAKPVSKAVKAAKKKKA